MKDSVNGEIVGGDRSDVSDLGGSSPSRQLGSALTPRERQLLVLLADGHTNEEIAGILQLGTQTVKNRVSRLMDKLGAKNRVQLAVYTVKNGLVA